MAFKVPEKYRLRSGAFGTSEADGNNGAFFIPVGKKTLKVLASEGDGWEHVSVSLPDRCPVWREMCAVKDLFWEPEDAVMQLHPPQSEYVNHHPFCLHLWRPIEGQILLPPSWTVGPKK